MFSAVKQKQREIQPTYLSLGVDRLHAEPKAQHRVRIESGIGQQPLPLHERVPSITGIDGIESAFRTLENVLRWVVVQQLDKVPALGAGSLPEHQKYFEVGLLQRQCEGIHPKAPLPLHLVEQLG